MQEHSFFPHNDRRFCHTTSDYLHDNADAREYLRLREEVWKTIYNANVDVNPHLIEKIFAFGYVLKDADSLNKIDLQINTTATNFSLKLVCKINFSKEELSKVLTKYGSFTVNGGISFNVEIGETFAVIADPISLTFGVVGVNTFYKLKDKIESKETQTAISQMLKKHSALITSDLSEEMLFRVFLDMLIYKIDLKIKGLEQRADMENFQNKIQPYITKLNQEVEWFKNTESNLNNEAIIVNRMNVQLKDWHKSMDNKMANMKNEEAEKQYLNSRPLSK